MTNEEKAREIADDIDNRNGRGWYDHSEIVELTYNSADGKKTRYVPYKEDATSTLFLSEQVNEMSNNIINLLTHVDSLDMAQTGIITRLNELAVRVRDMENAKNQPNTPF